MSLFYSALQAVVVGGAVAASLWFTLGKYAPRLRARLAAFFTGRHDTAAQAARGCATGCDSEGSCGGCSNASATQAPTEQPIRFHSATELRDSRQTHP